MAVGVMGAGAMGAVEARATREEEAEAALAEAEEAMEEAVAVFLEEGGAMSPSSRGSSSSPDLTPTRPRRGWRLTVSSGRAQYETVKADRRLGRSQGAGDYMSTARSAHHIGALDSSHRSHIRFRQPCVGGLLSLTPISFRLPFLGARSRSVPS